jgi:hypothetical protein
MGNSSSKLHRLKNRIDLRDHRESLQNELKRLYAEHAKPTTDVYIHISTDRYLFWFRSLFRALHPERLELHLLRWQHFEDLRRYLYFEGPTRPPQVWCYRCQQYYVYSEKVYLTWYKWFWYREYMKCDDGIFIGMWNQQVLRMCYDLNVIHSNLPYLSTYSQQIVRIYNFDELKNVEMQRSLKKEMKTILLDVLHRYPDEIVMLVCDFLIYVKEENAVDVTKVLTQQPIPTTSFSL